MTPSQRPARTRAAMRREVWALARAGVSRVSTAVVLIPNRKILKQTNKCSEEQTSSVAISDSNARQEV